MELQRMPGYKRQLRRAVYSLAKLCAIGPKNSSEGVEVCRVLRSHGVACTLGKFSKAGDDPVQVVHEYQQASNALKSAVTSASFYLSLKPPALDFSLEHAAAIAAKALQNRHSIHFDSHGHLLAEPTAQLLERLMDLHLPASGMAGSWRYGLTLPSRWKRSLEDAQFVTEMGLRARLVKGEFKATSSFDEMDPARGFLALVDRLAGNVPEIAVATHDYALAREAIARCKSASSPVQLELLFGMPAGKMIALAREMGVPVGFYVPYGDTLLVYGIYHFLTNPHKLLRPDALKVVASHKAKLTAIVASL